MTCHWRLLLALALLGILGLPSDARSQVALVLAIDVSRSMHDDSDALRQAHADALRHPAVAEALVGSRVSVALWGGWARLAAPRRDVRTPADALALADAIEALGPDPAQTSGA
jgi:hypothetical protein